MLPGFCCYFGSSNHDACNCPHRDYIDATHASMDKTINDVTDKMIEMLKKRIAKYSHCFSHRREDIKLQEPVHNFRLNKYPHT